MDPDRDVSVDQPGLASRLDFHRSSLVNTPCFTNAVSVVGSASRIDSEEVLSIFPVVVSRFTCNSVPSSLGFLFVINFSGSVGECTHACMFL